MTALLMTGGVGGLANEKANVNNDIVMCGVILRQ
jgi:hypothetical protein